MDTNTSNAIFQLLLTHLDADVRMHRSTGGGYEPCADVLCVRDDNAQWRQVEAVAAGVRGDWYREYAGKNALHLGFRDNRDGAAHVAALTELAARLRRLGFNVRETVVNGVVWSLRVLPSARRRLTVLAMHPAYIEALRAAKARA